MLRVDQSLWKRNHWIDHTRLTINQVICFLQLWKKLWHYVKPFLSNAGTLRTDGETGGQNCYINIARQCADVQQKLRIRTKNKSRSMIDPVRSRDVLLKNFWGFEWHVLSASLWSAPVLLANNKWIKRRAVSAITELLFLVNVFALCDE